jgi:hypothetical protein
MAEADPLKRVQSAARRASGPVSVDTQRRWYQNDLHHDLGLDSDGKAKSQKLRVPDQGITRAKLLTFLLLAAFAGMIIFTVHLAREGAFDALFEGEPFERPDLSWMGAAKDRAAAVGEAVTEAVGETPAPPNFFEPDLPEKGQSAASTTSGEERSDPEPSEIHDTEPTAEAEL